MDRQELKIKITDIASSVLGADKERVSKEDLKTGDIEEWDSLGHIKLLFVIENKLKIKFSTKDMLRLDSIGKIIDRSLELLQ